MNRGRGRNGVAKSGSPFKAISVFFLRDIPSGHPALFQISPTDRAHSGIMNIIWDWAMRRGGREVHLSDAAVDPWSERASRVTSPSLP